MLCKFFIWCTIINNDQTNVVMDNFYTIKQNDIKRQAKYICNVEGKKTEKFHKYEFLSFMIFIFLEKYGKCNRGTSAISF